MHRTALLMIVLGLLLATAIISQQSQTPAEAANSSSWADWLPDNVRTVAYANPPVSVDSVSEAETLSVLTQLYDMQAQRLAAMQRNDTQTATRLLDTSLNTVALYTERPGFADRSDTRTLVHTLKNAYQDHYGVPDTLDLPQGDIFGIRSSLFATLNRDSEPDQDVSLLLEEALPVSIEHTHTDVPMVMNDRVRQSIAFLIRNARLHLYPWMRRTDTYFPMIEHIFAEEDVPDELKYLALVESGMNPFAYSHAHAAGIWQFVPSTARQYGLTIDPWVDERRDPEKSTRAAARLLRDLHTFFGDWHLALAGYNYRPSRVKQAVNRAEQRLDRPATFWDIYDDLPNETRNYVPSFIATAMILSDPSTFDLLRTPTGPRYAFDHVPVYHALSLATIAEWVGEPVKQIKALNPELRSDQLPASDTPYYVRIPYGSFSLFAEAYDSYAEEETTVLQLDMQVHRGDTVGRMAARHQISLDSVSHRAFSSARVGTPVSIPPNTYKGNVEILAEAGAQPIRVQYSARATRALLASDTYPRFETDLPGTDEAPPPNLP